MAIEGVKTKELVTHLDERGFFRELIRVTDDFFEEGFGQWSHSLMYQNTIKAWHIHPTQVDWWYVSSGVVQLGLHDKREGSATCGETQTLLLGDHQLARIVKIPPGVAHGCKVVQGPASLFYITSGPYDPDEEGRIPHDDSSIGFDWLAGPEIT